MYKDFSLAKWMLLETPRPFFLLTATIGTEIEQFFLLPHLLLVVLKLWIDCSVSQNNSEDYQIGNKEFRFKQGIQSKRIQFQTRKQSRSTKEAHGLKL